MAVGDDEAKVRAERARAIGLFRYQLIREAADPVHSTKERGKMVRELASREHTDPFGRRVRISRQTIDRWIRDWRARRVRRAGAQPAPVHPAHPGRGAGAGGGAAAGEPGAHRRGDPPDPAHPAGLGARRTHPAAQLSPAGAHRRRGRGSAPAVFGRFEAEHPNDLWIGDALHGLRIEARKTLLVRVPGRSFPAAARLPVGLRRGHRAAGRCAAPGAGLPRRAQGRICR